MRLTGGARRQGQQERELQRGNSEDGVPRLVITRGNGDQEGRGALTGLPARERWRPPWSRPVPDVRGPGLAFCHRRCPTLHGGARQKPSYAGNLVGNATRLVCANLGRIRAQGK